MPFSFINTVASWMLKKRIHQIELFEKYPLDVQNEELKKLIQISKNTEFGKQYEFSSIDNGDTAKGKGFKFPLVISTSISDQAFPQFKINMLTYIKKITLFILEASP